MRRLVAVFAGGLLGTFLRLVVDLALPHSSPGEISVSTIVVNTVGSFMLGLLVAHFWVQPATPEWVKLAVGPGLLGSFTTFSAIALNVVGAFDEARPVDGVLALGASVIFGLVAAWFGLRLGARLHTPKVRS
jgi:CrcB protein